MTACEDAHMVMALLLCGPILPEKIFDRFFEQSAQRLIQIDGKVFKRLENFLIDPR
jgi:hypothetical protein